MKDIGFVGLGHMGGAIARRLASQCRLIVFDLDTHRVEELVRLGARAAIDLPQLAQECDVIFTCLPTSEHVRHVVFGEGGLGGELGSGALVIDCTTGDPNQARTIAAELAERGVEFVDAPVSGGPQGAAKGTLAFIVGSSSATYERARVPLQLISPNVRRVGEVGAGQCVKLLNNVLAAGHRMLAFETAIAAAANAVDPEVFIDTVNLATGRSYATEVTMVRHIFGERLDQDFSVGLMAKDVRLGVQLVPESLRRESLILQVAERLDSAERVLGSHSDINRLIELYERAADKIVATSRRDSDSGGVFAPTDWP